MYKKVLTEQSIYFGEVEMPKNFEIKQDKLTNDILESLHFDKKFAFSKTWDMLNNYIIDHVRLKHTLNLINKDTWGNIYKGTENTSPLLEVNPVDLRNSPDYVLLYGVKTKNCTVIIYYDDNRRKGRSWEIELKNNMFVIFPSTNLYYISNKNNGDNLNFIQTITYEYA